MKKIEIRADGSRRVYTVNTEPSKTDQSQKKQCDVNEIIARYKKTGQVSHLAKNQGVYADISEIPDLLTATSNVQKAQDAFMTLPAKIRKMFDNDAIAFVNYMSDPTKVEEQIKLGLRDPLQKDESSSSSSSSPSQQSSEATGSPQNTQ